MDFWTQKTNVKSLDLGTVGGFHLRIPKTIDLWCSSQDQKVISKQKVQGACYDSLFYCSFASTGGLFLIIVRQAKRSRVYLTL